MAAFDAGALLFKIQSIGAAVFRRDLDDATRAMEGVEKGARKAAGGAKELGDAQDAVAKKSKTAKQGLDEQGRASETLAQKTARLKREQAEAARAAEKQAEAAKKLSAVLLTVGVATSAMIGVAIAKNTEFDAAMSNVRAATMATVKDQERLGEAALKAGADTAYSAREAANAEEELAKAGLTVDQIVGGSLNGSLALAAAGQLQVARSAEIMATSLTQFKLPAEQAAHVADVLAAGAGKAQGSVDDMALALSYIGPLANSVGWDLESTAGSIAYLATQGVLGEKAGTSLRGVLAALQAPSTVASKVMEQYGINVYDASGKMLSMSGIAEEFRTKLGGLTDQERQAAMGRIFGNESLLTATLLYDGGAAAIDKWTKAVDDSGYAVEQAAIRQDNLAGDIEKLGGAFDTALIRTGSGANDVLRDMVQGVTALVDMFGEAPAPVHQLALGLGIATAAVTLFAGAGILARVKFAELRAEMARLNVSMKGTAVIAGGAGLALTGVLAIVAALAMEHAAAKQRVESYATALRSGTKDTEEYIAQQLALNDSYLGLDSGNAVSNAEKLGISMDEVTASLRMSDAQYDAFANRVKALGGEFGDQALAAKQLVDKTSQLRDEHEQARQKIRELDDAQEALTGSTEDSAASSKTAADAYMEQADATAELEGELRKLIDTINEANGQNQDAEQANAAWRESLKGIKTEVQAQKDAYKEAHGSARGFKLSLDENTAAGSANRAMLAGVAGDAQKAAEAQRVADEQTMSAEDATNKYIDTLGRQREAFEQSARKAGFNKDEVKALADEVFALPDKRTTELLIETAKAQSRIAQFVADASLKTIRIGVTTYAKTSEGGLSVKVDGSKYTAEADGGHVKFYADGNERHDPQYARAGEWRVWAEPETGGEWYLPDSPAKRGRSLSLARDMLDGWGYQVTPKGARAFASGGAMWSRSVRRGEAREAGMSGRGYSLVDEALSVAEELDKKRAAQMRKDALRAERQYKKLEKAADDADKKLDKARDRYAELRDTILSWATAVSSSIKQKFDISDWTSTSRTTTKTRTVDGVAVTTQQSTNRPMSIREIAADAKSKAAAIKRFAGKIVQLQKKGYDPAFVMEIAREGVDKGEPIADELLKATKSQRDSINKSYRDSNKYADQAGMNVAKSQIDPETKKTYDTLIEQSKDDIRKAKRNAENIEKQLKTQTDRIIRIISNGYKNADRKASGGRITGPGSSTSDNIPIMASPGEYMLNAVTVDALGGADNVDRMVANLRRGALIGVGASSTARAGSIPVSAQAASAPSPLKTTEVNVTLINPIVKDPIEDAWRAGLIAGQATLAGSL